MAVGLRLLSVVNKSVSTEDAKLSSQSDYVVMLAALFCALFCAIGLLIAARCVCLRHPINLFMSTPVVQTLAPPAPGLNKKILQQLPTSNFSVCEVGKSNKQTDCAICLTEFSEGDATRILPRCGHVFHVSCVDTWLLSHSSCPSCRELVRAVGQCHHCGGISAHRGFHGSATGAHTRMIDTLSGQSYMRAFLP